MEEYWVDKKRKQRAVPRIAWPTLGFTDSLTLDQARERVRQLNSLNKVERLHKAALTRTAFRIERDRLSHSAFVPEERNLAFLEWLDQNTSGSETHRNKIRYIWAAGKKMIITLQLLPENFASSKKQLYRYLSMQEYSLAYAQKILASLNQYGRFTARLTGKFYEDIPSPRGHDREMISDSYLDSDSYFGPSEPLTLALLQALEGALKPEQHSWLKASVWLGLRPSELDAVLADRNQKSWRVEESETDVLWVYQAKLTSKPRADRWKPIPILYKEQKEAISILFEGKAIKPLTKTIKRILGEHVTLYGGRKGFTDLMLDKGHRLEDIAQWLGHSSIEMTWSKYKSRKVVHFKKS